MQQIYRQSDQQFDVYTTVFSPQVCRSGTRTRHVEAQKVVVAVAQYRSRWPKELDLNKGDMIQVLFKEDQTWWFGRLRNGNEGYFPSACVEPLQGGASSAATPTLVRRVSVPAVATAAGAPCGCTSGHSTPKLLRRDSVRQPFAEGHSETRGPSAAPPHGSPSLQHRVLDCDWQVVVAQYQSRWPKELDLNKGDMIQVLFKEDQTWWFGRLRNGIEGYFPSACVEPLQGGASSAATPTLERRVSVPAAGAPCGCTSGHSTPKLLRRDSIRRTLGLEGHSETHGSPSLLHRVLAKSRRKSCPHLPHLPHLPHPPQENGSVNSAFQPD